MEETKKREYSLSRIGIWLILSGVFLLLACTLVWACTAQIRSTVEAVGITDGNSVILYLSKTEKEKLKEGMAVRVNDSMSGSVSIISEAPISEAEVRTSLAGSFIDYTAAQLNLGQWNYRVIVSLDESVEDGRLMKVSVITEAFRPIDFLR